MVVARRVYRARLVALEDELLRLAEAYRTQLSRAVGLMLTPDADAVARLVTEDDRLDLLADHVRDETIRLIALQSPVADELRLLAAVLEVGPAVERIGELAVNVARSARAGDPDVSEPLMQQFAELGMLVDRLMGRALEHFARRRPDDGEVAALDEQVDQLRRHLHDRAVDAGRSSPDRVEWAVRLTLSATWLERAGDMGVHIVDQVPDVVGAPARPAAAEISRIAR